mmetsp:Transcript_13390/g.26237  ORF Transcript_13390/g.26237 Transcript_13390/m.26237 type:complete len:236 (+) Transcript_13390:293-1000(+)
MPFKMPLRQKNKTTRIKLPCPRCKSYLPTRPKHSDHYSVSTLLVEVPEWPLVRRKLVSLCVFQLSRHETESTRPSEWAAHLIAVSITHDGVIRTAFHSLWKLRESILMTESHKGLPQEAWHAHVRAADEGAQREVLCAAPREDTKRTEQPSRSRRRVECISPDVPKMVAAAARDESDAATNAAIFAAGVGAALPLTFNPLIRLFSLKDDIGDRHDLEGSSAGSTIHLPMVSSWSL